MVHLLAWKEAYTCAQGEQEVEVIIPGFEFSLELICMSRFFKKLKLHKSLRRVQFQLFDNLTSIN